MDYCYGNHFYTDIEALTEIIPNHGMQLESGQNPQFCSKTGILLLSDPHTCSEILTKFSDCFGDVHTIETVAFLN